MILFTAAFGGLTVGPFWAQDRPWLALIAVILLAASVVFLYNSSGLPTAGFSVTIPNIIGSVPASRRIGVGLFGAAAVVSLWVAGAKTKSLAKELLISDKATIVMSAGLIAVFAGGPLAMAATSAVRRQVAALPQTDPQRQLAEEFMTGSRGIGLLERALMFAFLAAGQPDAAALALTAKSLARGPSSDHGRYASEYFLLGTLASVIASLALSMAARAAIGLSVL
ncbi:hypothetical protein [Streptomyces sp. NPDC006552]|uniref:hypothetical protein n=1 Tax=Streptomyces sp. NPDC006552 TaxID=3157179 RepID=UPI00339F75CE